MFLSTASIRRPVAMCSLIIALSLLGINAYRKMGLEYLPQIDMPYITIVTIYPGGSPSEIETDIAKRIEDVVVSIDGLKHVTSACMENLCQTLLEFHLNVNVDVAANDVREKLDLIVNDFPSGTEKPKVLKFNINAKPIITLALTGEVPIDELYDFADNRLRDRITTLEGVADVKLIGGAEREVHVLLDREKLASRGLSSIDVVKAIQQEVRTIPSGRIQELGAEYSVKFDADYATVAAIGGLQVAGADGQRCYLNDIGEVRMSTEELRQETYIEGRPAIGIQVVKKAEANAEAVVTRVENAMAELQRTLPGGMELVWVTDDGAFIRATVDSTISNIWQGVALTALILFLFLYSFRTTVIVAITMPLTIIIGLFFMYYMGYTLNTVTLISIGLSIGILVTNSIVVLESIVKRMETSEDPWAAALLGAREIGVAVLASAGTNVVVLFPIAMMGSQVGLFLRPFALTMVVMTVVSLFISFTLTPIMCAVMLKKRTRRAGSILAFMERHWNRGFDRVAAGFAAVLRFFEKRRWAAALFLVLLALGFVQSLGIASIVGFTFITDPDRAEMFVKLEYPTRYDLSRTVERVKKVEGLLQTLPEIRHIFTTVGKVEGMMGRTSEGVYLAQILLRFSDKTKRSETLDELMEQARTLLADYPECIVTVGRPSGIGGQSTPIELEFYGDDFGELDRLVLDAQRFAREIWGLTDPDTTVRIGKPELRVRPNRAVLADLGVPATGLGMALRANLEGLEAGIYKQESRNYDIVVKLKEIPGKSQVSEFLLPGAPGHPLLLSNVSSVEEGLAPVQILRKDKRRISKLFAGIMSEKPLGAAVNELVNRIKRDGRMPADYYYRFGGEYEIMEEANIEFAEAGLLAIILVYLTLAAVLESFKQPLIILLTIPLGLVGILLALWVTSEAISVFVLLGAVMLIGIVVNNAILIMDQLNQFVTQGVPRHEAMVRAASDRFRPIIMITLAAILGMFPLAVGRGLGSEMRTGIGIASIGGIAVSAVLTLIVLPIVYDLFTRRARKPRTEASGAESAPAPSDTPPAESVTGEDKNT